MESQRDLQKKKIIWAFDPFLKDKTLIRSTALAIKALVKNTPATIEPVFLFSTQVLDIPSSISNNLAEEIKNEGQAELNKILKKVQLTDLQPLNVIIDTSLSLSQGVHQLTKYARTSDTDLIVVATRGQKGPKRWVMGSFAETLILQADVPIFVINPNWDRAINFKHILFPTDFSPESKLVFRQVIELAKAQAAEITVYHKIKYDLSPALELAMNTNPTYKHAITRELDVRRAEATQLAQEAESAGLRISISVEQNTKGSVADSIVKKANLQSSFIAMAAHSGGLRTALIGSVTRRVIRNASCPVWILHSEKKSEAKHGKLHLFRKRPFKKQEGIFSVSEDEIMDDLQFHGHKIRQENSRPEVAMDDTWPPSDNILMEEVIEALANHPRIDSSHIDIEVAYGEVNLKGTVPSVMMKHLAEKTINEIPGVVKVQNNINLHPKRASS
jgi:nucleotide-binding universal stress UspA family protein